MSELESLKKQNIDLEDRLLKIQGLQAGLMNGLKALILTRDDPDRLTATLSAIRANAEATLGGSSARDMVINECLLALDSLIKTAKRLE